MLAAQEASAKAVESGRISAAEVAALTFAAIDDGTFYIVPHEKILDIVKQRLSDVIALQNPSNVFALTPQSFRAQ